jgi:twitching motility protein PilT
VLVASPAGGGRTTTIAAMIDACAARGARVVSFERAIEIVHAHRRGLVSQRVIGEHAASVSAALSALDGEDAAVIAAHDLPDAAAIDAALALARAGRLVIAGVAAVGAAEAIEHVLAHAQPARLAGVLGGAVAQALLRRQASAGGLVAAFEVLIATDAVLAAVRQNEPFQLASILESGRGQGMIGLSSAIADLVRARAVSADEAMSQTPDPAAVRALLGA